MKSLSCFTLNGVHFSLTPTPDGGCHIQMRAGTTDMGGFLDPSETERLRSAFGPTCKKCNDTGVYEEEHHGVMITERCDCRKPRYW